MRKLFYFLCGLLLLVPLAACSSSNPNMTRGSGNIVKDSRQASGFQEVSLATDGLLTVEQTGSESVTLEGDDNILPLITTDVQGGRLTIGTKTGASFSATKRLAIHVTVKDLRYLGATASGDVSMAAVKSDTLTTETSSSGNIQVGPVTANTYMVKISSSGNVTAIGTAPALDVTSSSSGSFDGRALQSARATVRLTSSGDATVRVSDSLNATLSSSGSLKYLGSPQVTKNVSSSGTIEQTN